jgi:hypothetical protein
MVKAILASRYLQVRETTPMQDGKTDTTKFDIEMTSLAPVWTQLVTSCASATAVPKSPWPAPPWPNVSATPSAAPSP